MTRATAPPPAIAAHRFEHRLKPLNRVGKFFMGASSISGTAEAARVAPVFDGKYFMFSTIKKSRHAKLAEILRVPLCQVGTAMASLSLGGKRYNGVDLFPSDAQAATLRALQEVGSNGVHNPSSDQAFEPAAEHEKKVKDELRSSGGKSWMDVTLMGHWPAPTFAGKTVVAVTGGNAPKNWVGANAGRKLPQGGGHPAFRNSRAARPLELFSLMRELSTCFAPGTGRYRIINGLSVVATITLSIHEGEVLYPQLSTGASMWAAETRSTKLNLFSATGVLQGVAALVTKLNDASADIPCIRLPFPVARLGISSEKLEEVCLAHGIIATRCVGLLFALSSLLVLLFVRVWCLPCCV